jgi:hypothetical protein
VTTTLWFFHSLTHSRLLSLISQHNVSDVVAGWVLGLVVAGIYLLRSTPRYKKVLTYIPEEEETEAIEGGC